ncbi:MAG: hypothetical protein DMG14_03335 [Acidobacteria bacterium]|nr:MAG: hypothetical protein DMG14_03335 [Acidobacteriota bacterium]
MEEAEYCHRLAFMYKGGMIALDTPGNLKSELRLQSMEDVFEADRKRGSRMNVRRTSAIAKKDSCTSCVICEVLLQLSACHCCCGTTAIKNRPTTSFRT